MNYPTREQANFMIYCTEDCKNCPVCEDYDAWCQTRRSGEAIVALHDEIDRLTAMLPKVVVPKNLYDSDCYRCECNAVVGLNYFSASHNRKQKYCGNCGSRLDWDKVAEVDV
jgi:hypothetical protein